MAMPLSPRALKQAGPPATADSRGPFVNRLITLADRSRDLPLLVFYVDIQDLGGINSEFGRAAGDYVLAWLEARLGDACRELAGSPSFVLQRIRDDEFALGFAARPALAQDHLTNPAACSATQQAADLCYQLSSGVAQASCQVFGQVIPLAVSIGAALAVAGSDRDMLLLTLSQADHAARRFRYVGMLQSPVFNVADRQLRLEQDSAYRRTHQALQRGQVVVHYQPKVDLNTNVLVGLEALVRFAGTDGLLVYPDAFIPYIEDTVAIETLGFAVMETALRDLDRWRSQGALMEVAVNVSSYQLCNPEFVGRVRRLLALFPQVAPYQLSLEVVETRALKDMQLAIGTLTALRENGVTCHLDDFGTGYASFAYLNALPVSALKIDRAFISTMLTSKKDAAIVRSCLSIADAFGIMAIAEGVETPAEAAQLRDWGCHTIQGYLVARPMPYAEVLEWQSSAGFFVTPTLPPRVRARS